MCNFTCGGTWAPSFSSLTASSMLFPSSRHLLAAAFEVKAMAKMNNIERVAPAIVVVVVAVLLLQQPLREW